MKNGDRVKLSECAKKAGINRRSQDRLGIFVGLAKGFYIKVLWDGLKSVGTGYHPDFIVIDATLSETNGDRGRGS